MYVSVCLYLICPFVPAETRSRHTHRHNYKCVTDKIWRAIPERLRADVSGYTSAGPDSEGKKGEGQEENTSSAYIDCIPTSTVRLVSRDNGGTQTKFSLSEKDRLRNNVKTLEWFFFIFTRTTRSDWKGEKM